MESRKQIGAALIGLVVAAGTAAAQTSPPTSSTSPSPRCDIGCVQASIERAVQLCVPRIEAEAPGDYEWLYRPVGGVFKQADTPENASSTVARYRGDNVRFLNAQSAWVRVMYECGFDTAAQQVAYVRVTPGVLGKPGAVPRIPTAQAPRPPTTAAPGTPTMAPAPNAAATASAGPQSDIRKVREPSTVDVRQVPASRTGL